MGLNHCVCRDDDWICPWCRCARRIEQAEEEREFNLPGPDDDLAADYESAAVFGGGGW
jgi:hypothetical protein